MEDHEFASSMEIDAIFNENVNFLLRLKDSPLRKSYDNFNKNNQTMSSLLILCVVVSLATFPFIVLSASTLTNCKTALETVSWSAVMIALFAVDVSSWKMYMVQRNAVAANNGRLPEQSRYLLRRFEFFVFTTIQLVFCYVMFYKVMIVGSCEQSPSQYGWNCNVGAEYRALPDGVAVAIMVVPMFYGTFGKGSNFEFSMMLWFMAVATLVICLVYSQASSSVMFVSYYAVSSFIVLFEARRLNYFLFFTHQKLQGILKEKERAADAANAEEMRHMIANVAHDLKTPLSSFLSGIEVIAHVVTELHFKRVNNNLSLEDMEDCIFSISQCVTNMRNTNSFMLMTINRCIDYTKASKGVKLVPKYETIDLVEALRLPMNCMLDIQQRVTIHLEPIPKMICSHLISDKQWLQENVLCLLSNAVKYSNEGIVTVQVSLVGNVPERIASKESLEDTETVYSLKNKEWKISQSQHQISLVVGEGDNEEDQAVTVRFEVEDHGIGLSDEAMTTLFNPFRQAQRLAGGTGLGLFSMAKRIEALGGTYGVQHRRDGKCGCLFWFEVPYRPDRDAERLSEEDPFFPSPRSASSKRRGRFPSQECILANMSPSYASHSVSTIIPGCATASNSSRSEALFGSNSDSSPSTPVARERKTASKPDEVVEIRSFDFQLIPEASDSVMNVLIVDDSPAILKMTAMILRRHRHIVSTATNGAEALERVVEYIQQHGKGFDVVVMDLQMPVMDGLEATRRLREMESDGNWSLHRNSQPTNSNTDGDDTPLVHLKAPFHQVIIGCSANSDVDTANEARRVGVDSFMTKPFSLDMFYRTYDEIVDRQSFRL